MHFIVRQRIFMGQIIEQSIRHQPTSVHYPTLIIMIIFAVQRIVTPQILVQTDTQQAIAHHNTLVQTGYLSIHKRYTETGVSLLDLLEYRRDFCFLHIQIRVLIMHVFQQHLHGGVKIILPQTLFDTRFLYGSDSQHLFYKQPCRSRVFRIHTLERSETIQGNEFINQTVITEYFFSFIRLAIRPPGNGTPPTRRKKHSQTD